MFYHYRQNNSGGYFLEPAIHVFIQADSVWQADVIAEENGLYFNGCEVGRDCPCCGDRWYGTSNFDAIPDADIESEIEELAVYGYSRDTILVIRA